jgi:hypothetical protein
MSPVNRLITCGAFRAAWPADSLLTVLAKCNPSDPIERVSGYEDA